MLKSTDTQNRDDLSHFASLDRPLFGSAFFKPEMGSVAVVIVNVRPDDAPQLAPREIPAASDHLPQASAPAVVTLLSKQPEFSICLAAASR
jgi:hypothetical protein